MTKQVTTADRYIADTTAFVTLSLIERLMECDEATLPGGYAYHVFSGFAGFADYAGQAGLALARALDGTPVCNFVDLTDAYANAVLDLTFASEAMADRLTLRQLADSLVAKCRDAEPY